jgi:alpha-galactosidase
MGKCRFSLSVLLIGLMTPSLLTSIYCQERSQPPTRELSFNRAWAERAFADGQAANSPVDRLVVVQESTPGDAKKNLSSGGSKIQLGDKTYAHGLGVTPRSVIRVALAHPAERFKANIGMDRPYASTVASVRFIVMSGDKKIFASEFMKALAGGRSIDVPLNGSRTFDLIVEAAPGDAGSNEADWADASVQLQDGSQIRLDDLADQWDIEPGLPFSFTLDGKSSLEFLSQWKKDVGIEQLDANRIRRTVTLQDPATGLEVRAVAVVYADTPGVDWTLYLTNHGAKDSPVIENLNAADVVVDAGVGTMPLLERLKGSEATADDWLPYDVSLQPGKKIEFGATGGRSSEQTSPFFNVRFGGGGVITAVGWSGDWKASTEWQQDGKLHLQAGLRTLHLRLHPGESIRSPRIMQLYWIGADQFRPYNLFRRTMFAHVLPRIDGQIAAPPIVHLSTSFYELNESTESDVLSHLNAIKGLGFETLWLDAYWTKNGFPQGMGNYGFPIQRVEPADRFPHGLKPVGDAAHRDGLGFLVWFEPERVYKTTYLAKEHPEWVITLKTSEHGLFNLGMPEAREFMTKYLTTAIKEYGMDWLRIDYNISPATYWKQLDDKNPDRVGLAEIRYIEGLYKMWDDIRQDFPHLMIDNCASGGRRIDLETSSRSLPLWRTDGTIEPLMQLNFNQAALQNQVMTAGLSRYVPFSTSGEMGATPYLFRSGFNAGISFGEDVRPATYPRELLAQGIEEGKRLRKYYFGNFYPLTEVTTSAEDWQVLQYHRTADQDGMIVAFRRGLSPYANYQGTLNEIVAEANYEVGFYPGYALAKVVTMKGSELQHLRLEISEAPGTLVVEYKRISR